ncbi:MAG: NAD(P)-dependent oxidoreductase [Acidobacteriota bacterium]|nr:NAD(P)-dependent oxidoreductase [Acidobacteriota bacterium]
MKVLVADKFPPEGLDQLRAAGCTVHADASLADDSLQAALAEHQPGVLVVRSTKVRPEHLDAAPSLSLIVRAGAGVNTIDVAGASQRGIFVANCPGKNSIAVAELAFAHILSLDRRVVDGAVELREGQWNKKEFQQARGIFGQRLGLLGLGQIALEMIPRARAFGLEVAAWSRSLTPERAEELEIECADSPVELARRSDILSIHVALNDDTTGLVGEEVLAALPDGAMVINTSRGPVVDTAALEQAVKERGLRAGLDVFENEPSGGTGELDPGIFALPGVQGSHHIGASTTQAQLAVAAEAVRVISTFLEQGTVPNCVNLAQRTEATHLLVVRHHDRVGVLANVLQALRQAGINVQEMENILFAGGGAASARIQLAKEPSEELVRSLEDSSDDVLGVSVTAL